jgi:hypothetical protein
MNDPRDSLTFTRWPWLTDGPFGANAGPPPPAPPGGGLLGLLNRGGGLFGQLAPPQPLAGSPGAGGAWPTLPYPLILHDAPTRAPEDETAPPRTPMRTAQLAPRMPSPWPATVSEAGAAQPSADDEPAAAQAAARTAAERLRRGVLSTRSAPPQESPPAPLPEHLESAAYWGAARAPSEADDQRQGQGSYLAPAPQAPTWEQVVPTATPWSVSPKLPSATSWGDIINGIDCRTSGDNLHCITPGGRRFAVPADGLPDGLRIAPGERDYHYYSTPDGPVSFDPSALMQGVIDQPTRGRRQLVAPATTQGTPNDATPYDVYPAALPALGLTGLAAAAGPFGTPMVPPPVTLPSPVKSYLTTDQNGTPMVVNVTQPHHPLHPGIVVRYVTASPSGSTIQNEGTGLGEPQSPSSPGLLREWINNVWKGQSKRIVDGNR